MALDDWRALRSQHLEAKAKLARTRKDCDRLVREVKAQHKVSAPAAAQAHCMRSGGLNHNP